MDKSIPRIALACGRLRKCLIVSVSALALTATSAYAAQWGCGAQGLGGQARTWKFSAQGDAEAVSLRLCSQAGGRQCRIISCSPDVDGEAKAKALWPPRGRDTTRCGGPDEPKCLSVANAAPVTSTVPSADCALAETHWKAAEDIKTVEVYEDHLRRFPTCPFATLARVRIETLQH